MIGCNLHTSRMCLIVETELLPPKNCIPLQNTKKSTLTFLFEIRTKLEIDQHCSIPQIFMTTTSPKGENNNNHVTIIN